MRLLSVRGLIVAVALAAQALAALHGPAAAAFATRERGDAASICEQQRRHLERRLPGVPEGRDSATCFSCALCLDGFAPVPVHVGETQHPGCRDGASVAWPPLAHLLARSTIARSNRARAPPVIG